ncbi:phage tail protein [Halochromatium glycolicum]|jgi:phage tail-like protein|uniref:Phage tail protein n=1 Tax=Halochromatium glycolicum TaxID=85075 RepID=A0AAJ0X9D4_9GAMM|nr:phage tail protein [Halochromatium glycolicum]MBK1704704.1 phage tail protein [Halochromatium glycolicum]
MPRPFTTFNFKVLIEAEPGKVLCDAEFSDCDGLEVNMEPKTIREGGNNGRQIHLAGPVSYGQLSLKRGMTSDFALWRWFEQVQRNRTLRASGRILMLASDRSRADVRFDLTGCLPVKLKAPTLSAKDGEIAIEEMQIAYETLHLAESGA